MKLIIRTFLSGALIVVPLAITISVLWSVGAWMDEMGRAAVDSLWGKDSFWGKGAASEHLFRGAGAMLLIALVYVAGMLTRLWVFRWIWGHFERLLARVPGVKIIYESVRDLIKLFGGGSNSMGRAVEYRPPGTDVAVLGILTNENPIAAANDPAEGQSQAAGAGPRRVAVYLPMAYMLGGPTILTSPEHLRDVDMTVEHALKLAATAHVGGSAAEAAPKKEP
jgi:uncharacterized membrane protein